MGTVTIVFRNLFEKLERRRDREYAFRPRLETRRRSFRSCPWLAVLPAGKNIAPPFKSLTQVAQATCSHPLSRTQKRMGRDSNPRDPFGPASLAARYFLPLSHPSVCVAQYQI